MSARERPGRCGLAVALLMGGLVACTAEGGDTTAGLSVGPVTVGPPIDTEGTDSGLGTSDEGTTSLDDSGSGDSGSGDSGIEPPACSAPDVLVLLDRTGTMYLDPGGAVPAEASGSRWAIAVEAVAELVQSVDPEGTPLEQTVRFGLELFPQDEPGCTTVGQSIAGMFPTNGTTCLDPELLVVPALGTGATIAAHPEIDASAGVVCESTPLRKAIEGAGASLAALASSDHEQYVLLVTDGADTMSFCSTPGLDGYPDSLVAVQNLQAAGVGTFILGVGNGFATTGDVHQTMNDFACAGGTAPDPDVNCTAGAAGMVAQPGLAQALYFSAVDTPELVGQLVTATGQVCCGCVPVG